MSELSGTYLGIQKGEHADFWRVKRDDGKTDARLVILNDTTLVENGHYTFKGTWNMKTFVFETEDVTGESTPREPTEPKPTTKETQGGKNASYALSYAKDLSCSQVIEPGHILSYAKVFEMYLDGKLSIKDDDISRHAMEHVKKGE